MSLPRLWAFLAVALPVLAALIANLQSVDLTYHLRAGGEILDTGAIPTHDGWTFTAAGEPWIDQQWGAQVILAAVYRAGGWIGLVLLRAALVGAIFGSLLAVCRQRGLPDRTAALLVLAGFVVASPALALRPQLLGMALLAVVLVIVSRRRDRPRGMWLIPIIVLFWANLHGSFFLGPLVLGLAWLEDVHDRTAQPHRTLAVAVVAVLAACVTPSGPSVWLYSIGLSTNPEVTSRITEWQPTSLRDIPGLLFFGSVAAVAALLARTGRATPWPTLAGLAVFVVIGAYASRGIAWWPLGAVTLVSGLLPLPGVQPAATARSIDPPVLRRLNAVVAGVIILAGVVVLPVWRPVDRGTGAPDGVLANAPSGITAALRELVGPGDRILNPQAWGSWFEFAVPQAKVAIDSRIEFFPRGVWDDYDRIASGAEGWKSLLDRWDPTMAVVERGNPGLATRLTSIGWATVYSDGEASILVSPRRPAQAAKGAARIGKSMIPYSGSPSEFNMART